MHESKKNESESEPIGSKEDLVDRFMHLYPKIQRRLWIFIIRLVPNVAAAEDLLQETYLVLWEKFYQFDQSMSFYSWACGIAEKKIMNYRMKKERKTLMLDPDVIAALIVESNAMENEANDSRRDALVDCLDKLKVNDRELIMKRYEPGITVNQIASDLNRTPNAISQAIGRIRDTLLDCIQRTLSSEKEDLA